MRSTLPTVLSFLAGSGLASAICVAHYDPETHACDVICQSGMPPEETRAFHLAAAYAYQVLFLLLTANERRKCKTAISLK